MGSGTKGSLGMGIGWVVAEVVGGREGMELGSLMAAPAAAEAPVAVEAPTSLNIFSSAISHFISVCRGTLNKKYKY